MTQDRDPEMSESTRRLIDALGRQRDASNRSLDIRGRRRRAPLHGTLGFIASGGLGDDDEALFFDPMKPRRRYRDSGPPRYLVATAQAITKGENVRIWLHGEDARERDRACAWLASFAAAWGWDPVTVPLTRQRRSGYDARTERGEIFARQLVMGWEYPHEATFHPGDFARSGPPLAVILRDPGPMTAPRHAMLTEIAESLRDSARGSLVALCTESSGDSAISEFESIRCESSLSQVGRRIATLRAEQQISRDELARIAGIPATLLAMLESGFVPEETSAPDETEYVIQRLAKALRVPFKRLYLEESDLA